MTPREAAAQIQAALETVPNLRVAPHPGTAILPPAAMVGPPRLTWSGFGLGKDYQPSSGQWPVYVVTSLTEYATAHLLDLVGPIAAAIDERTAGVVTTAGPRTVRTAEQGDLPAYEITVEMDL